MCHIQHINKGIMIRFQKIKDKDNEFDNTDVLIETISITVTDLLEDFKHFLNACGYIINGTLVVEPDEE